MADENSFPQQFEVEYTFASGGHNTLKFMEGRLFFFSEADSHLSGKNEYLTKVCMPKNSEWDQFWENMDKIGIWAWETHYQPEENISSEVDIWQVKIKHGSQSVNSRGWYLGPESMDDFFIAVHELFRVHINHPYPILSLKLAEY